MKSNATATLLFSILVFTGRAVADPAGAAGTAHVAWSVADCAPCHAPSESAELAPRVSRPCRALCATCHDLREGHHPVGVVVPGPLPTPLLLTKSGTNTCTTCHDVTRPRFAGAPWTSRSLFARLSRRRGENRTYYLVVRNDRGQLCRSCH